MTVLRAALAAVVLAAGLLLAAPTPAFACDCATADTPQFVKSADVVVVGQVTAITPPPEREVMSSGDPATYTLSVAHVMKGTSSARVDVLSAVSGASCGLEGIEEGGDYLVFANYQTSQGTPAEELWAGLCGGTRGASASSVAEVEAVTGPGRSPEPAASRVAVDDPPASATDEGGASDSDSSGWLWAGGAATVLVIGGLLVVRRRRAGA